MSNSLKNYKFNPNPGLKKIYSALSKVIRRPSNETLDVFAERHVILSQSDSNIRGKIDIRYTPHVREVYKEYSNPYNRLIALRWGSQTGKTQFIKSVIAHTILENPKPALLVQPDLTMAESFSKDRLQPMIDDMPILQQRMAKLKSRSSANTILHKRFLGGHITIAGSNSPSSLAMRPIAIGIGDEINRWSKSAGKEGSPRKLLEARLTTFPNAKSIYTSSPTFEGDCEITRIFELTDQRYRHIPCPVCGHTEKLEFESFKYDKKVISGKKAVVGKSIRYLFECGHDIGEVDKFDAFQNGIWIPSSEPVFEGYAGFDISALYSIVYSWEKLINEYLESVSNTEEYKVFWNTKLNKLWREKGDSPDVEAILAKRELYPKNIVPRGGIVIVAAIDVQKDYMKCVIRAYGKKLESWILDYRHLIGDVMLPQTWNQVDELLEEVFEYEDGCKSKIHRLSIDSGDGNKTTAIYNFVRKYSNHPLYARVIAIKGSSRGFMQPICSQPTLIEKYPGTNQRIPGGIYLWSVGTNQARSEMYQSIRTPKPKEGEPMPYCYMHFCYDLPEEYFHEVVAEVLIPKKTRTGKINYYYEKKPGQQNEAGDCEVYNRHNVASLGMDRWTDEQWDRYYENFIKLKPIEIKQAPKDPKPQQQNQPRRNRNIGLGLDFD